MLSNAQVKRFSSVRRRNTWIGDQSRDMEVKMIKISINNRCETLKYIHDSLDFLRKVQRQGHLSKNGGMGQGQGVEQSEERKEELPESRQQGCHKYKGLLGSLPAKDQGLERQPDKARVQGRDMGSKRAGKRECRRQRRWGRSDSRGWGMEWTRQEGFAE